ncbi:MAG: serine/threonine-protein phosphatase [Clostridia bacterium]|nr:serine/threonine-protein phosphatase [Clostridia bacterium]
MNFIISANTDIGIVKDTNQDGLSVKIINTPQGRMAFAVLCDGMGGLSKGEVASTTLVSAFNEWVYNGLPALCSTGITDSAIRSQWEDIVVKQNKIIGSYGASQGIRLGTTVVVMLITQSRYYIMNIGDSRAYEIFDTVHQLTEDQTFVAREIKLGKMTPEEAKTDSRRNVLLQCIGASDAIYPDMFFGDTKKDAVYMLCSDGFRHEITSDEMYEKFRPGILTDAAVMDFNSRQLIELNKQRSERDNISVALIKTF